jgi:cell division protein FtsB
MGLTVPSQTRPARSPIPINLWVVLLDLVWYLPRILMALAATGNAETGVLLPRPRRRRLWSHLLVFTGCVLLANALIGEKGLTETKRADKTSAAVASDLARLRRENAVLRDEVRRLRSDPATIESVARAELGLLRRGEILVTIKDLK